MGINYKFDLFGFFRIVMPPSNSKRKELEQEKLKQPERIVPSSMAYGPTFTIIPQQAINVL